jgi:hypothetical protein
VTKRVGDGGVEVADAGATAVWAAAVATAPMVTVARVRASATTGASVNPTTRARPANGPLAIDSGTKGS